MQCGKCRLQPRGRFINDPRLHYAQASGPVRDRAQAPGGNLPRSVNRCMSEDTSSRVKAIYSVRLDADRILVTPSGACKGDLAPQDLLIVDLGGAVTCGTGQPSSEMQMHLLYYRSRPDVRAVCHGHPPAATGLQ